MSILPQHAGAPLPDRRWEPEWILRVVWQRKGWFLLGFLLCLSVGVGVGLALPKTYQASAIIAVVKKTPDAVTGWDTRGLSTEMQISPPQDLLRSTLIIDRAVQSKKLASLSIFAEEEEELTEVIKKALSVVPAKNPSGQSYVFKLNYRGRAPEDCKVILDAVLESYREYMTKKHQTVSEDTVELIVRDKRAIEKELAAKEAEYRAFRENAPLFGKTKDVIELRHERLAGIQTKLSTLLMQRVEIEAQLTAIKNARKEGRSQEAIMMMLSEFARKTETEAGRDKNVSMQEGLFPLLMEERKLLETHGPKHPEVLAVQKRIEIARRLLLLPAAAWNGNTGGASDTKMPDPVELNVQLLEQKLSHIKISEELLNRSLQTEQDEARRLGMFEIQNDSFRTTLAMHQALYESLTKRLNEVSLVRNAGGYEIETIEPPSTLKRPMPTLLLALALGGLIGLLVGVGLAYWADRRHGSTAGVMA